MKLEDLLLRHGSITAEQLESARKEQKKWGGELGRTLVDLGFISEKLLMKALAHQLGLRFCDPAVEAPPRETVTLLGVQLCERYGVIAVGFQADKKLVEVATSDPTNEEDLKAVASTSKLKVRPATATAESIQRAIRKHYYGEEVGQPAKTLAPEAAGPSAAGSTGGSTAVEGLLASQLIALAARITLLEEPARQADQISQLMVSDPNFSSLLARLEQLEQLFTSQLRSIKVLGELLVEHKLIPRDELYSRLQKG
jgi:type IV pilus assembly protein PilB